MTQMSKIAVLCTLVVMMVFLAGCASSGPSTAAPPTSPASVPQAQPQAPQVQPASQPAKTENNQSLGDIVNQLNPLKQTTATLEPKDMAITRDEVPEEYGIKERGDRSIADVSENGKSLGWQKGYVIVFSRMGSGISDMSAISQYISIYPSESMSKVMTAPETEENYTLSMLPDLKIGDQSQAYKETAPPSIWGNAVRYTIEFRKLNVYEYLSISGTGGVDYETLKELAKKAEQKIE